MCEYAGMWVCECEVDTPAKEEEVRERKEMNIHGEGRDAQGPVFLKHGNL